MTTTTRRLAVITGAVALFLVVVWYLALFSPQNHHLAAAHRDKAASDQKISSLNGQIASLKALEKQIPADKAKLANYKAAVPDNPQLPSALRLIQQAATNTGVDLSNVSPTPSSASSSSSGQGSPSLQVAMNASGSYTQLSAFIAALNAMPRTLVIDSMNMSASGLNGSTVTASLTTQIFDAGQPTP